MIKIFHEAPKSIFKAVQQVTDGDYALANLLDDPEYFALFDSRRREVILDNGVFELGKAFEADVFASWVEKLRPTYYIVPDVLEDCEGTRRSFENFMTKYPNLPGKVMCVAQGKNYEDFVKCYQALEPYCERIGISFDCSWYQDIAPDFQCTNGSFKRLAKLCMGRQLVLERMDADGIINRTRSHHLLGVALPQDMIYYHARQLLGSLEWIESVDTSNPVVHGLHNIAYARGNGLLDKLSTKLYTLINETPDATARKYIMYNIQEFRRYTNGF